MPKRQIRKVHIINAYDKSTVERNTKEVLEQLKDTIVNKMDGKNATVLLYWLNDWGADFLINEKSFDYSKNLIKYDQYSIFEADFGFKVGSEAGGLHYGAIIDKDNSKSSPVVMVVPFKSLGENEKPEDIDEKTEVYLGDDVFKEQVERFRKEVDLIDKKISSGSENPKLVKRKQYCLKQIKKLSKGTIAQVGQMCLMSKLRIYYPTRVDDELYGLKLSPENVKKIMDKFNKLYF